MTEAKRVVLDLEEKSIHDHIMEMGALARDTIKQATDCARTMDHQAAQKVIDGDGWFNDQLRGIEHECVVALASQQPVAGDLRRILTGLHIAQELERIADHSADIAKILLSMEQGPSDSGLDKLSQLGQLCSDMLDAVMEAYDSADADAARKAAARDDEVDELEQRIMQTYLEKMRTTPARVELYTRILWISHNLERIGDRVTNIAERVVFMVTGDTPDLNTSAE